MDAILRESKIVPGNSYTYQAILNAVSKKIHGKKANIECTLEQVSSFIVLLLTINHYSGYLILAVLIAYDCFRVMSSTWTRSPFTSTRILAPLIESTKKILSPVQLIR